MFLLLASDGILWSRFLSAIDWEKCHEKLANGNKEAQRRIEIVKRDKSNVLDSIPRLGLETIPEELGQLANLKQLDLSDNQISEVPEALGQLANLKVSLQLTGSLIHDSRQ